MNGLVLNLGKKKKLPARMVSLFENLHQTSDLLLRIECGSFSLLSIDAARIQTIHSGLAHGRLRRRVVVGAGGRLDSTVGLVGHCLSDRCSQVAQTGQLAARES